MLKTQTQRVKDLWCQFGCQKNTDTNVVKDLWCSSTVLATKNTDTKVVPDLPQVQPGVVHIHWSLLIVD